MSYSFRSIPFFTDDITIIPHTATAKHYIGERVSIRTFSRGLPVSLERIEETGELLVTLRGVGFIQGPEV